MAAHSFFLPQKVNLNLWQANAFWQTQLEKKIQRKTNKQAATTTTATLVQYANANAKYSINTYILKTVVCTKTKRKESEKAKKKRGGKREGKREREQCRVWKNTLESAVHGKSVVGTVEWEWSRRKTVVDREGEQCVESAGNGKRVVGTESERQRNGVWDTVESGDNGTYHGCCTRNVHSWI